MHGANLVESAKIGLLGPYGCSLKTTPCCAEPPVLVVP